MNTTRIFAILLRHYYLALHQMERFFDVLISPILMIILWGFLTKYVQGVQSHTLASFLLGGILLWAIFEKVTTDIGVNFMFDIWDRNFIPLVSTPITFLEYLTGLVVVSLVKIFISFMVMAAIALIFYGFNALSLGFGLVFFAINLFIFAASFGIFNVALVIRFGNSIGPLTWILPFLVQPLAAVFYPISVLPPFFQSIAFFIPISHVFEGMRYILKFNQFNSNELLAAFVLNVVYFILAVAFFAFILKSVQKSGKLVKII